MDYNKFKKEELVAFLLDKDKKIEELNMLNDAQETLIETLEENKKVDYQYIDKVITDSFKGYTNKYNMANPRTPIEFKIINEIGQCEPYKQGDITITAKASLKLIMVKRHTLTGKSEDHLIANPTFGFQNVKQIEHDGWQETLYSHLFRVLTGCMHKVVDAELKG